VAVSEGAAEGNKFTAISGAKCGIAPPILILWNQVRPLGGVFSGLAPPIIAISYHFAANWNHRPALPNRFVSKFQMFAAGGRPAIRQRTGFVLHCFSCP
jgi:hypothetical protein